jgi:putative restriction endonuclease
MNLFVVVSENDESAWEDETGVQYHFPKRYLQFMEPGTKMIYYKGKLTNRIFENQRLTPLPHYFGIAEIDNVWEDKESNKGDYFASIKNYSEFERAVEIINPATSTYYELIPESRKSNYWRDGIRVITEDTYNTIVGSANLKPSIAPRRDLETEYFDGTRKVRYSTFYERNPNLRKLAIEIHKLTCKVCDMNFAQRYGSLGQGFIHVHHLTPLHSTGRVAINPERDLTVVCPNCHYMIHRPKGKILTIEELRAVLAANR